MCSVGQPLPAVAELQMDTVASFAQQMGVQGAALDKLRDSTQQLEAKITEARVSYCTPPLESGSLRT